MTTKADLIVPTSAALIDFENGPGNTIDADLVDQNFNSLLSFITTNTNFLIDQSPETTVATTYTALQTFEGGILTDTIQEATLNSDIIVTLNGIGLFKYGGSAANLEVATQAFVNSQISAGASAVGIVMTGSTSGSPGTSGAVPTPAAGTQNRALTGGATFADIGLTYDTRSTTFNAVVGNLHNCSVAASFSATLPAGPADGDVIGFLNTAGNISSANVLTIARNTNNIMGLAEDMTVTEAFRGFMLRFTSTGTSWELIPVLTNPG